MIGRLLENWKNRNKLDISDVNKISAEEFVKILKGNTYDKSKRDRAYFIVCKNGLEELSQEEELRVSELFKIGGSNLLNKSEWFGKFCVNTGESKIIVPWKYDLGLNTKEKKLFLSSCENAQYYGSGFLQLDKDLNSKIIRTDVSFEKMRAVVNNICANYIYGYSLDAWNK